MELQDAIQTFAGTMLFNAIVAVCASFVVVIGWVFMQDYLRNRARTQNKMWRDL